MEILNKVVLNVCNVSLFCMFRAVLSMCLGTGRVFMVPLNISWTKKETFAKFECRFVRTVLNSLWNSIFTLKKRIGLIWWLADRFCKQYEFYKLLHLYMCVYLRGTLQQLAHTLRKFLFWFSIVSLNIPSIYILLF